MFEGLRRRRLEQRVTSGCETGAIARFSGNRVTEGKRTSFVRRYVHTALTFSCDHLRP